MVSWCGVLLLLLPWTVLASSPHRGQRPLSHQQNAILGNHPPTFTLNNNQWPHFADRSFVEDGGLYFVEQWGCGVSDCNGGGQGLNFKFRLLNLTRPDPAALSAPFFSNTRVSVDEGSFWERGPVATEKREPDKMDPGVSVGNWIPNPDLCNGLPLIPCYGAGSPDSSDSGYASLNFETAEDKWGLAFYEVWLEDDGDTTALPGVPCHCQVDAVPCPAGQLLSSVPCNSQCNRGLAPNNPTGCNRQVFAINIIPVNDPPSFVPARGELTTPEDSGMVTHPSWACNIDHGGWMEWPYQSVDFDVVVSDPTFFTALPAIATVPPGEELPCRDLTYTLAPNKCGKVGITVTPRDSGAFTRGEVGVPRHVVLHVTSVNDPPTFTPGPADVQVDEGGGGVEISLPWAMSISPGAGECESPDELRFTVRQTNGTCDGLFDTPPSLDLTGTLKFAPHAYANGRCCFLVELRDSAGLQNANPAPLCINVSAVNHPPVFTPGEDLVLCSTARPSSLQWATNICPGAYERTAPCDTKEGGTVRFEVTPVDPTLVDLSIDAMGVLRYTPLGGVGTTEVSVRALDSGGASSNPSRFTVTVLPDSTPSAAALSGGPVTVTEDAGDVVRADFLTAVRPAASFLASSCWATPPTLFAVPPQLARHGHDSFDLTFRTAQDATGVSNVQCALTFDVDRRCSNNGSLVVSFPVTILPVDDPPFVELHTTCTPSPEVVCTPASPQTGCQGGAGGGCTSHEVAIAITIREDTAVVARSLLKRWGGGPPDEDQSVVFEVSGDTSMFSPAPSVDPVTGAVTLTPARDVSGEALLHITAIDSGGNRSPPRTIKVYIQSVNDPPVFDLVNVPVVVDACPTAPCPLHSPIVMEGLSAVESGQTVEVAVQAGEPSWFTDYPTIIDRALVFRLTPGGLLSGSQIVSLIARDDGGRLNGGEDTTTKTLELVVVARNVPPSFEIPPHAVRADEDAPGVVRILRWARSVTAGTEAEDRAHQAVRFSCTLLDPSLLKTAPSVDHITGDMVFEVAPNRYGNTLGTCQLRDDQGGVSSKTFGFEISPVNDCPSFVPVSRQIDVFDLEASSPTAVTQVSAGPLEPHQTVSFLVSTSRPALFAVPPTVKGTALHVHPIDGANGPVSVQLIARDDGGTQRGGCDSSPPSSVTVMVHHANRPPTFVLTQDVVEVGEDVGEVVLESFVREILPGHPTEEQTVSCRTQGGNADAFDVLPSVVQRLDSSTARLVFRVRPDVHGSFRIGVVCEDNGLSQPPHQSVSEVRHFNITVSPVNDPPSFRMSITHMEVWEDSGLYEQPRFLHSVSPGPGEVGPLAAFCTAEPTALFVSTPAISLDLPYASLVFTPAPDKYGTAVLRCCVVDESYRTCDNATVVVRPINDPPRAEIQGQLDIAMGEHIIPSYVTFASPVEDDQQLLTPEWNITEGRVAAYSVSPGSRTAWDLHLSTGTHCGVVRGWIRFTDTGGSTAHPADAPKSTTLSWVINVECLAPPPPTFTPGSGVVTLCEDQGWTAFPWASPAGDLPFALSLDPPGQPQCAALFRTPPVLHPNGTLAVHPAPNASGICTYTASLQAAGSTASTASLKVDVRAVNDPPSFTAERRIVETHETCPEPCDPTSCWHRCAGSKLDREVQLTGWCSMVTAGEGEDHQKHWFELHLAGVDAFERWRVGGLNVTNRIIKEHNSSVYFEVPPHVDSSCTLRFLPRPYVWGSFSYTVVLRDDGGRGGCGTARGEDRSDEVHLEIRVLPINNPPVIDLAHNVTIYEDSGVNVVRDVLRELSPGPFEGFSQSVSLEVVVSDPRLFSDGPRIASGGRDLVLAPAPDITGLTTVVFRATDTGSVGNGSANAAEAALAVRILPVNDPPVFVHGPPVECQEDSSKVFVEGWAQGISPGPYDESGQAVTFVIGFDDPADVDLFASQPMLDSVTGDLVFTPARDAFGRVGLKVQLVDTGPGDLPHRNASSHRPLEITIAGVNDPPSYRPEFSQLPLPREAGKVERQYAMQIVAGPANEAYQTLSFIVTVLSGHAIYRSPPRITAGGLLVLSLEPRAHGTSQVQVVLHDSEGGTSPNHTIAIVSARSGPDMVFELIFAGPQPQASVVRYVAAMLHLPTPDRIDIHSFINEPDTAVIFSFNDEEAEPRDVNRDELSATMLTLLRNPQSRDAMLVREARLHLDGSPTNSAGRVEVVYTNSSLLKQPALRHVVDTGRSVDDPIGGTSISTAMWLLLAGSGLAAVAALLGLFLCCRRRKPAPPPIPKVSVRTPPPPPVPVLPSFPSAPVKPPPLPPQPPPPPPPPPPEQVLVPLAPRYGTAFPDRPPRDQGVRTSSRQVLPLASFPSMASVALDTPVDRNPLDHAFPIPSVSIQ